MAGKRPTTVAGYIAAAPPEGRAMLERRHAREDSGFWSPLSGKEAS